MPTLLLRSVHSTEIRDSTAAGRTLLTAADKAAQLAALTPLVLSSGTITASAPILGLTQTWNAGGETFTGAVLNITDTASAAGSLLLDLKVGGASKFSVDKGGIASSTRYYAGDGSSSAPAYSFSSDTDTGIALRTGTGRLHLILNGAIVAEFATTGYTLDGDSAIRWAAGSSDPTGLVGLALYKDSDGILAQRNSTAAQEYRVYNTDNGANDEFASVGWLNNANVFGIETEKTGSGSVRNIAILGGNIGIGTASPASKLDVYGVSGDHTSPGVFRFQTNSGTNDVGFKMGGVAGAGVAGYLFIQGMHPGVGNDANVILNPYLGNVGIGTTSPASKLHVAGAITSRELSADPANPAEGEWVIWQSDGHGAGDDGDILWKITAGGSTKTGTLIDFSAA